MIIFSLARESFADKSADLAAGRIRIFRPEWQRPGAPGGRFDPVFQQSAQTSHQTAGLFTGHTEIRRKSAEFQKNRSTLTYVSIARGVSAGSS